MKQLKQLRKLVSRSLEIFIAASLPCIALAQPTISSLSSYSGIPGSNITITGTNFNSTAANDIVFFGATQATVTAASSTSLTVTIPSEAIYNPVSVLNTATGLTGYSVTSFLPTYNNAAYVAGTVNFDTRIDSSTYGSFSNAVAIGDLDGDGKTDVVGANYSSGNIFIYRNTSTSGTIAFAGIDTLHSGTSDFRLYIADIDGDGKPDIVIPNRGANTLTLFRNTSSSGSISFASAVSIASAAQPNSVAVADIDGDGKADLVVANQSGHSVSVFRNTGTSGSFSFASRVDYSLPSDGYQVAIGDIDGDGKPDMAVSEGFGTDSVCIFRNTSTAGTISFAAREDLGTPSNPLFVALSDMDGDGKADMITVNLGASNFSVYRNTSSSGSISFAARADITAGAAPGACSIGDIDGDGKPDICVANGLSNNIGVFRNTGSSGSISFASTVNFSAPSDVAHIATGDIDGDDKPDVVIVCQGANKVSFFRNDPLQAITGTASVCVGSNTTLSDATPNGTWKSSNTAIATVNSAGVVHGVASGTATVTYAGTAGTGYTGNLVTATVTVNALPTITSISASSNPVCLNSTTTFTAAGVAGVPAYNWSGPNSFSSTATAPAFTPSTTAATGVYSLTVTNTSTGCVSAAKTTTLTVNALPVISAGAGGAICAGASATLTSTGGTSYTWSPSTGLSATTGTGLSASPASTITYTVTGTDTHGCKNTATQTVSVNPLPAISAGASGAICTGSSATLTAIGGATYIWSPSTGLAATTGTGISASPASTITYTVTGTDLNGCKNTATQTVTVNALPTISAGASVAICSGTSTALSGSGGLIYTWAPSTGLSATTGSVVSASPSSTITYTLTGTDLHGCINTATKTVTVNALPNVYTVTGGGAICVGSTGIAIGVSGSDVGAHYQLYRGTTPITSPTGTGSALSFGLQSVAGTYTVVASNTFCSATMTGSATVLSGTYPVPAVVAVTGGGGYCSGGTGVNVGLAGSAVGINYQLYQGTTAIGSPVAGIGAALSFGPQTAGGTYTVIGTNATTGCTSDMSGSATVYVDAVPTVYNVRGGGGYCPGGYGVHIGLSGSNTGISYKLYRGGTPTGISMTGTGAGLDFGLYTTTGTYTITATNLVTGCTSNMSGSAMVATYAPPTITSSTPYVAPAGTLTLTGSPSGGRWTSAAPAIATVGSSSGVVTGVSLGTAVISYTLPTGCAAGYTIHVTTSGSRETNDENNGANVKPAIAISVVPNPNNGSFSVKGSLISSEDQQVSMYVINMAGQTIYTGSTTTVKGVIDADIHLPAAIPTGMYQLILRTPSENNVLKILVQR